MFLLSVATVCLLDNSHSGIKHNLFLSLLGVQQFLPEFYAIILNPSESSSQTKTGGIFTGSGKDRS